MKILLIPANTAVEPYVADALDLSYVAGILAKPLSRIERSCCSIRN